MKTGDKAYYRLGMRKVIATSWKEGNRRGTVRYYSNITGMYHTMLVHEVELTMEQVIEVDEEEMSQCQNCKATLHESGIYTIHGNEEFDFCERCFYDMPFQERCLKPGCTVCQEVLP